MLRTWLWLSILSLVLASSGHAELRPITQTPRGNVLIGTVHILPGAEHTYTAFATIRQWDLSDCASEYIKATVTASRERVRKGIQGTRFHVHVTVSPETPLGTYYAPIAISRDKDREGHEDVVWYQLRIIVVDQMPKGAPWFAKWLRGGLGVLMIVIMAVVFLGMTAYIIFRVVLGVSHTSAEEDKDEEEETEPDEEDEALAQEALEATTDGHPPDEVV